MSDSTKRINLAFTRAGTFVMTGGVAVDIQFPYNQAQIDKALKEREFAEFLPLDMEFDDDDWEFEEIKEEEDTEN